MSLDIELCLLGCFGGCQFETLLPPVGLRTAAVKWNCRVSFRSAMASVTWLTIPVV